MVTSRSWQHFRRLCRDMKVLVLCTTVLAVSGSAFGSPSIVGDVHYAESADAMAERRVYESQTAAQEATERELGQTAIALFRSWLGWSKAIEPPAESGYGFTQVVELPGLKKLVGFEMLPETAGEAVVLNQDGVAWRVSLTGDHPPAVFGDISDRIIVEPAYEEGLLGLAFSPSFDSDGEAYLFYTAGEPRRSVISRFLVVDDALDMSSERVILEIPQPYGNHNGGQLAFGPDGYLYVSVGDGGAAGDPDGNGQDLSTLLGAILRLDVSGEEYAIPPDNPFVDDEDGARPEIYAYGLRNPWRISFDRETGDLWTGDVGQDSWEEIDEIVAGGNYGWSVLEGNACFKPATCDPSGMRPPRAVYGREDGCSVIGGYVYRGASLPELDGYYIYADFCTGKVWGVNTSDESRPIQLAETTPKISTFGELPDGELVALAISGELLRLERAE